MCTKKFAGKFVLNILFAAFLFISLFGQDALACDPCSIFSATQLQNTDKGSVTLSVSEQYTNFNETKDIDLDVGSRDHADDDANEDSSEEIKSFSTTQVSATYDVLNNLGIQLTLPIVHREFFRVESTGKHSDDETGIGDMSLIAHYLPFKIREPEYSFFWGLAAGVKFPTGDTGALEGISAEEAPDDEHSDEHMEDEHIDGHESRKLVFRSHPIVSATGGRALTLGTGSYDYILGSSFFGQYQKALFLGSLQYTIRTEGDFDYEFSDDLIWNVGPATYIILDNNFSCALRAVLSGEHKEKDHLRGQKVEGSKVSNLYAGPELLFTFFGNLTSELGVDIALNGKDDESAVPDYRIRGSFAYRF